ncbi:MAG TPA: hypothetical protein VJN90_09635 [Candidatus Acidoferrales bacterium]|nr:hypothetical protein [Candidatus Acidoferrales bacterium]
MAGKNPALFGIYVNLGSLQKSMDCLKAIGIKANDIAILLSSASSQTGRQGQRGSQGSLPSFLVSTTRISVPVSGVLIDTLISLGMPVYDAERYENRVQNGGVLIYVRCLSPAWFDRVHEVLRQTGAEDVSFSRDARGQVHSAHVEPYTPAQGLGGNGALLMENARTQVLATSEG